MAKRADFEGDKKEPPKKIERLEKELKKLQKEEGFKSVEARFDEEHNLWEVNFVNKHGAEHVINWVLASSAECRQMIAKYKQIEPYMEPPFIVETVAKAAPAAGNGNADGAEGEAGDWRLRTRKPRSLPSEKLKSKLWRRRTCANFATTSSMKDARTSPSSATKDSAK